MTTLHSEIDALREENRLLKLREQRSNEEQIRERIEFVQDGKNAASGRIPVAVCHTDTQTEVEVAERGEVKMTQLTEIELSR